MPNLFKSLISRGDDDEELETAVVLKLRHKDKNFRKT